MATPTFKASFEETQTGYRALVDGPGGIRDYQIAGFDQANYADFFLTLANDHGTRVPLAFTAAGEFPPADSRWKPLLTENLSPTILAGYGDPAVLKLDDGYVLVATSNDAPNAFPILRSVDLIHWHHEGFVFPAGKHPSWTAEGELAADFWAPEMARISDGFWLCFAARQKDGVLALGLAKSAAPIGPWRDLGRPLLSGPPAFSGTHPGRQPHVKCGLIDPHAFVDTNGEEYLFWKSDSNGIWPRPLATLLREKPGLIGEMFEDEADKRTAAFAAAAVGWANGRRPMERFFLMQPLIEAALANWETVRRTLRNSRLADSFVHSLITPIFGARLDTDGAQLLDDPTVVLENDLDWEGHLIEGPFVTCQNGRYWMFYAGNDFSTPSYGIGVAVADHPLGPYIKVHEPILKSTRDWLAPGHPSIAAGLDGEPRLFFHAFRHGTGGYNVFRALLTTRLSFSDHRVEIT